MGSLTAANAAVANAAIATLSAVAFRDQHDERANADNQRLWLTRLAAALLMPVVTKKEFVAQWGSFLRWVPAPVVTAPAKSRLSLYGPFKATAFACCAADLGAVRDASLRAVSRMWAGAMLASGHVADAGAAVSGVRVPG